MKIRHLACALALFPLAAHAADTPAPQKAPEKPVPLVKIDDFTLTNLHFSIFAAQQGAGAADSREKQVRLLNELVNTFMVARSPRGRELAREPELQAAMEVSNARLLARAVINDFMKNAPVSEEEIQAAYKKRYGEGGNVEYKARHILVDSEQKARELIAELDKGADFDKLAREHSTGPTRSVGGDLGWFTPDSMVKPFADAVAALKDGEYTHEPVETRFGWHVILREQSRKLPAPKLEEVRDKLVNEIRTRKLTEYVRGLRDKTKVEVVEAEGEPAGKADPSAGK